MTRVTLETWTERVEGIDEMGRVLTYGDTRIGHYFADAEYVAISSEYVELLLQAIKAIAHAVGLGAATRALHNARIVP